MNKSLQDTQLDAGQDADEQRTEPYIKYDEGAAQPATPSSAKNITRASGSARRQDSAVRILCIEDEHFISELYARALTRAGYDVKLVLDGLEGLKEAATDQYDIILLDIMLPNITGVEVLRRLKAQVPDLHAKLIITTNLEQREETREDIEKMADGYLIKAEITPKQLVQFLQSLDV